MLFLNFMDLESLKRQPSRHSYIKLAPKNVCEELAWPP